MPTNISNIEISGVTYPLYDSRFGNDSVPITVTSNSTGISAGTIVVNGVTTTLKTGLVNNATNTNYYPLTAEGAGTSFDLHKSGRISIVEGTESAPGFLTVYKNNDNAKQAILRYDRLQLGNSSTNYQGWIKTAALSENRIYQFPNEDGTVALTSDIPVISATSALTTGITTGTITVDGVTTTFYAPDGSKDYYIEASVSAITPQEGTIGLLTLTNGDTLADLQQRYSNGQSLYIKLTDLSTNDVYILSLNENSTFGTLEFTGDFRISSFPIVQWGLIVTIYPRLGDATQASLEFHRRDKVCQEAVTTTATTLPVMLGYSGVTTTVTNTLNKTDSLLYNPSTKLLQAGALGVTSGIGYTTTLPTTTAGFENGQIMFVVFEET